MKANNFNGIAFLYDTLVRLVFGSVMKKAQTFYLAEIKPQSKVLIVGGGTGWILKSLPADSEVWYVDYSSEMITRAKKQTAECRVHFIEGTEEAIPQQEYDVVITNFYLDLFAIDKDIFIISKARKLLKPTSIWIATDFVENAWWHSFMLKLMFTFFRVTSNIESNKLPDWQGAFVRNGFSSRKSAVFYSGFIKTIVYSY